MCRELPFALDVLLSGSWDGYNEHTATYREYPAISNSKRGIQPPPPLSNASAVLFAKKDVKKKAFAKISIFTIVTISSRFACVFRKSVHFWMFSS